jgi:hypothetical protein
MQFIIEFIQRIRSESPRFFIVLRWMFGVLALVALAVKWAISAALWQPPYALAISELCAQIILVAVTVWGTSFLPVADKKVMDTDPIDPPPHKP